jgi:hypothetical protein
MCMLSIVGDNDKIFLTFKVNSNKNSPLRVLSISINNMLLLSLHLKQYALTSNMQRCNFKLIRECQKIECLLSLVHAIAYNAIYEYQKQMSAAPVHINDVII